MLVAFEKTADVISLGSQLERIYKDADAEQSNLDAQDGWGDKIFNVIFGKIERRWVDYTNQELSKLPEQIVLRSDAGKSAAYFAYELKNVPEPTGAVLSMFGSIFAHNPVGVAIAIGRIFLHGLLVDDPRQKSEFNASLAKILTSYSLMAEAKTLMLKRGRWFRDTDNHGIESRKCGAGLMLPEGWTPAQWDDYET